MSGHVYRCSRALLVSHKGFLALLKGVTLIGLVYSFSLLGSKKNARGRYANHPFLAYQLSTALSALWRQGVVTTLTAKIRAFSDLPWKPLVGPAKDGTEILGKALRWLEVGSFSLGAMPPGRQGGVVPRVTSSGTTGLSHRLHRLKTPLCTGGSGCPAGNPVGAPKANAMAAQKAFVSARRDAVS